METPAAPSFAIGVTRHSRKFPKENTFQYPSLFLRIPMRSPTITQGLRVGCVGFNRAAPISFRDKDHGVGDGNALAWVFGMLAQVGIKDEGGAVWLHTYPRYFGFTFKPVSFWYIHAPSGELQAVLAEVNNTFGERHCYLIHQAERGIRNGEMLQAKKVFHVSPFMDIEGYYRFQFVQLPERSFVKVDLFTAQGLKLATSLAGNYAPITLTSSLKALIRFPLQPFLVVARIHFQAIKLWFKKITFFRKPAAPAQGVTLNLPNVYEPHQH